MKIVISKTVLKELNSICNDVDWFVKKIKRGFVGYKIYLKRPYVKIKINLCNKGLRIVARYDDESDFLLIIFVFEKKDKIYGENLIWDTISDRILIRLRKIEEELRKGDYKIC